MARAMFILTIIGALLGAVVLVIGVAGASGAPQEAAAAAIAVALAVIPYCLARAAEALSKPKDD